jgi:hypothetical protein
MIVNEYEGRYIPCSSDVVVGKQCPLPDEEVIASLGIDDILLVWFLYYKFSTVLLPILHYNMQNKALDFYYRYQIKVKCKSKFDYVSGWS